MVCGEPHPRTSAQPVSLLLVPRWLYDAHADGALSRSMGNSHAKRAKGPSPAHQTSVAAAASEPEQRWEDALVEANIGLPPEICGKGDAKDRFIFTWRVVFNVDAHAGTCARVSVSCVCPCVLCALRLLCALCVRGVRAPCALCVHCVLVVCRRMLCTMAHNNDAHTGVVAEYAQSFEGTVHMPPLKGHRLEVTCLCWLSPTRLASGGADNTVCLWDMDTGACVKLKGHR